MSHVGVVDVLKYTVHLIGAEEVDTKWRSLQMEEIKRHKVWLIIYISCILNKTMCYCVKKNHI